MKAEGIWAMTRSLLPQRSAPRYNGTQPDDPQQPMIAEHDSPPYVSAAILEVIRWRFAPNSRRFMPKARCAACRRGLLHRIVYGEIENKKHKEGDKGNRLLKW